MKYYAPILAGLTLALGGGVLAASAQDYTPLAPLPIGPGGSELATWTLSTYLVGMIKLLVAVSGAIAVLMLVISGTQYVAAGINPSAKGDAKERIAGALIGLTLVLTSYLILNSIDPRLVEFNLTLPQVGMMPTSPAAITATPTPAAQGELWPSDSGIRSQLANAGVSINRPTNCTYVGQRPCTSVTGLGQGAINGLIALKSNCSNCTVVVTAGTEYWMHGNRSTDLTSNTTAHRPGGNVVDISINNTRLNNYIRSAGTVVSSGCSSGIRYKIGSAIYVDERIPNNPPHWHVCY